MAEIPKLNLGHCPLQSGFTFSGDNIMFDFSVTNLHICAV